MHMVQTQLQQSEDAINVGQPPAARRYQALQPSPFERLIRSQKTVMNIRQLKTSTANHLIADFANDVNDEPRRAVDKENYGSIGHRGFDDVIFGISIFMVLCLIGFVIAIAFYTVM